MHLFLIDAIGPFFRGYEKKRINWSKIPYAHLGDSDEQWRQIHEDMSLFCREVAALGYNAVTLDDLAHLAPHPLHEEPLAIKIAAWRLRFASLIELIRSYNLAVYLTLDAVPMTEALALDFCDDTDAIGAYFRRMIAGVLRDFPAVAGVVLRIGESDARDVKDPIRSQLFLRNAAQANEFLHSLIPIFAAADRTLIFRTWTVGAHGVGDLIWHRETLDRTLQGIDSPHFIVSMKHGESDFFRYLPLNNAFFRVKQNKMLELQARREYEGAGEYPSLIAADCERFRDSLQGVENMVGLSVWCQTGGWHRFRLLAFLEKNGSDVWIRWNTFFAIRMFRDRATIDECLGELCGLERSVAAREFLLRSDEVILNVLYIENFARKKRFFRRVRIPPLIHAYWDSLYVHSLMRNLLRQWVDDPGLALEQASRAMDHFPRMIELAAQLDLPVDDIRHMHDLFSLMRMAQEYYFAEDPLPWQQKIEEAKQQYKLAWPVESRSRYRIKTKFDVIKPAPRRFALISGFLLRQQRGYRVFDHIFTLHALSVLYRALRQHNPRLIPKTLRKLAMGIDTIFH